MASTMSARYATGTVYGNVAYDLGAAGETLELPREERRARRIPDEIALERARARTRAREAERAKPQAFGVPLLGIIGAVAVAALAIVLLMGYVNLAAVSGETRAVEQEIAKLEEKNEALQIKHDMIFNMTDVETYAVNILGMVKADETTVVRHDMILADRAEILAKDETAGVGARLMKFLRSIPEYFQ